MVERWHSNQKLGNTHTQHREKACKKWEKIDGEENENMEKGKWFRLDKDEALPVNNNATE